MDFFTHLVFGGLTYLLFLKEVTLEFFFLATFFSILPDLDVFLTPLKRIIKSKYLDHRGGSHSYIIGIIISFIISLISSPFTHQPFFLVWIIGIIFYSLHVSMDLLTTTKIPYLYPLSKKEHSFYVEKAGSFFTFVNSIILLILPAFFIRLFAEIFFIHLYINVYTSFFMIYYFYRILSKIFISRTLDNNQKYFPGILPFYFRIYIHEIIGDEIVSSIEKKSHFSKKTDIIKTRATLSAQEKSFFEKAEELNNNHNYFVKWTSFPIFIRKEGTFSIKFFFLETMMRRRNMFIQYDFDIDTQNFIGANQGSGRIQGN
ncbi:MAG: metal-dependent hydrolase [Candidatus Lokiarchaeota archaeon]|nr:metal-dependent hydrolase [Candidatus Lokiarchaeota archaeon]